MVERDRLLANMKKKFDKYWGDSKSSYGALVLAIVLNPRFKLQSVDKMFEAFYDVSQHAKLTKKG